MSILHVLIKTPTAAATYAMELVFDNVKGIQASFDEELMRSHLEKLLINKQCKPFP